MCNRLLTMRRSKSSPAPAQRRTALPLHVLTLRFDGDIYDTSVLDSNDMQLHCTHNVHGNLILAKKRNHNAGDVYIKIGPNLKDPTLGFVKFMGDCEEMVLALAQQYVRDLQDADKRQNKYQMHLWLDKIPVHVCAYTHQMWGNADMPLQLLNFRGRRGEETLLDRALRNVRSDDPDVHITLTCRSCVTFSGADMEACIDTAWVFVDNLMKDITSDLYMIPLLVEGDLGEQGEPANEGRINSISTELNALGVRYDTRLAWGGCMYMCIFGRQYASSVMATIRRFNIAVPDDDMPAEGDHLQKSDANRMRKKRHARQARPTEAAVAEIDSLKS